LVKTKGDGTISRRAKGIKNVLEQQKCSIESYPAGLSEFEPFFSDEEKALDWTAWKLVGIDKYYGKGLCPFCAGVETEEAAAQTQLFSKSFDKDSVIFTSKLKEYILELKLYIDPERLKSLLGLLSADGDRAIFSRELEKIIAEAKYIRDQLQGLATFSGLSIDMNRLSELIEILTAMKIDVRLDYFNTSSFQEKIEPVNKKIDEITKTVSRLQESIAQLHACLNSQIRKRKDDINEFLKSAGFKYSFDIKVDGDGLAHALLLFNGSDETHIPVENPSEHLSWGERNVVSLLLFMFDAISKDSDLIILDDPISSFDSNKKYAIINRLFITGRREDSLYMRTVLLLTHDLEPVIDYIQVGGKLDKKFVNGSFVQNTGGAVVEFPIEKDKDILSTTILMKEIARDETVQISARIGCLRKYIEYTVANPLSDSIPYNILSSLIHGRKHPTYDSDGERDMSPEDTQTGSDEIKEFIPSFEYSTALDHFDRRVLLKEFQEQSNMYIKLLILRAYVQCYPEAKARLTAKNDVLRKYLDETVHVENDYLYSFDLRRFAIVPEYISEVAADFVSLECSI
jgi:wobble nucleotide-excising tRNase